MTRNKDDYYFFYGREGQRGWASQWSTYGFEAELGGKTYTFKTCEHWMMASKAHLFNNHNLIPRIVAYGTEPEDLRQVKKSGRLVKGFVEEEWDTAKREIVYEGNLHKFRANPDIATQLLATGNKIIVEASRSDRIWGIGYNEKDAIAHLDKWGQNLLGKALEQVRETLREEQGKLLI